MTLLVSCAGLAIGGVLGSLVAWAKLSGARIAGAIGEAYAALFRGLPELLIIYFVYFGSSALLTAAGHAVGFEGFLGVPSFAAAHWRLASFRAPIRRNCSAAPISRSRAANSRPRSASAWVAGCCFVASSRRR